MTLSKREMTLAMLTLGAVLFGLTYWGGGPALEKWKSISDEKTTLRNRIKLEKKMIERAPVWEKRLQENLDRLTVYAEDFAVTPELLTALKNAADKHGLELTQTRPGSEKAEGELFEIAVSCSWQGSLEALSRFMYELQNTELLCDIRQLGISPSSGKDSPELKGTAQIICAYRRGTPAAGKETPDLKEETP